MFEFLKHALGGQNQFAAGGLLLMIVGGIGVYLRAVPTGFLSWVVEQTTMMVTLKDEDPAYRWVKEWFLEQKFMARVRRVDVDSTIREELSLVPSPGRHLFWRGWRPFWAWVQRSEDTKGWAPRRIESLTFRTWGRDQNVLKRFLDEVVAVHEAKCENASHLYVYEEGWSQVYGYSPRLLDSVILKPGEKEHLLQDIERFRGSRERYQRLGVPYHRGYLLYGPPGTGKTSLVSALAGWLGMSIYSVNLTEFNDRSLKKAMNFVPEDSMILFEDIDCMKAGNKRRAGVESREGSGPGPAPEGKTIADVMGVTLSGLLNVLDGFHAPENVLFVMTTNRIEALDEALLRPGRIDYKLYMGSASAAQKTELYCRFFPDAGETDARAFAQLHSAETMAEFQGLLLALEQREASPVSDTERQVEEIPA